MISPNMKTEVKTDCIIIFVTFIIKTINPTTIHDKDEKKYIKNNHRIVHIKENMHV